MGYKKFDKNYQILDVLNTLNSVYSKIENYRLPRKETVLRAMKKWPKYHFVAVRHLISTWNVDTLVYQSKAWTSRE